ncbi:DNA polymerase-4 [Conyzicola lurida]|uniref:DNA polymerase IV n=1 Tax=Conyzicola lurida TaxID=1172621 RepID=A0A841AIP8_9MICO|nr:DNA polymerase IV [Conyzicola lurida]MBB5843107.1 DNA polymerase-4 [Conyzicola lurida]
MSKQDGSGRQTSAVDVDDSTATVLHVDMDAFFASVELLDRPDLRGKPVIVAHDGPRSVVTAATYEARKFGVNSAMPLAIAKRRCPQAIVLEPHFDRYSHYSAMVMAICDELTPSVERLGIDEAFLDVAGSRKHIGSPITVATLLRRRVLEETGLICSVGAAATKFVAKLASSRSKPNGLLVIPRDETIAFLHPLPIGALWGVGGKTEESLTRHGLRTIGDLAQSPVDVLKRMVGEAAGSKLHDLSWGIDPREVQPRAVEKSIGHEVTFETDVTDPAIVRRELLRLSGMVAVRLRSGGAEGRTVVLKLRFGDFTTITRSRTLSEPTDLGRRIYDEVSEIYSAVGKEHARVRLVGVRIEQLSEAGGGQVSLWDDDDGWREAEDVMDAVSARFGRGSVTQASLLGNNRGRESEARGFARDG